MKKAFFLLILLVAGIKMLAQTEVGQWTVTPRVGINFAKLTDPDVWVDTNWKMEYGTKKGLVAGVEVVFLPRSLTIVE